MKIGEVKAIISHAFRHEIHPQEEAEAICALFPQSPDNPEGYPINPLVIDKNNLEKLSHFGVVRDWIILLKSGQEIILGADVAKFIIEHKKSDFITISPKGQDDQDEIQKAINKLADNDLREQIVHEINQFRFNMNDVEKIRTLTIDDMIILQRNLADQILTLLDASGWVQLDENQELPEPKIPAWKSLSDAYSLGQKDMLAGNFMRVKKRGEEGKEF